MLKFVTDEQNRINAQYNNARQINTLADAERKSKELVEGLKPEIDDIKNKINILSDLVKEITINAGEIEVLKQQIEIIREKLKVNYI